VPEAKAFRALRFTAKAGRVEDLVAPPYDVISSADRARLAARSRHNIVHITLPGGPADAGLLGDRYGHAAKLLGRWLDSGALEVEAEPSMTVVREIFTHDGRELARTGVETAVRLSAYGEGDVYPHERTLSAPKADRLALMRATRAQPGPVFMLVPDEKGDLREAIAAASARAPDHEISGPDDASRCAWIERDAEKLAAIERAMADRPAIIADGHHRYETALGYRDEVAGAEGDPGEAAFVLAHIVPIGDAGLVVQPTHRAVGRGTGPDADAFLGELGKAFDVQPVTREEALEFARTEPASGDAQAFIVAVGRPARLLRATLRDPAAMDARAPERAAAWRALDVPCLHLLVLEDILGVTPEQVASGAVSYSHDAAGAIVAAVECEDVIGFIMRPTPAGAVAAVARAGERMPQKSTYFYPKVASGFAMRLLK
jgi:uncharacterized protein (DUF1015 family)